MSLIPEIERELLRVAHSPVNELEERAPWRRRWHVTSGLLAVGLGVAGVAVAGLLLVLLGHKPLAPGHHVPTSVSGRFPGAPHTQPGKWPEGFPCPPESPSRYLPRGAGCVSVVRADVDGDGRPDLIVLYALGIHRLGRGFVPTSFILKVVRASGGVLSVRVPHLENDTIIGVRNVNSRPGSEIFIQEGSISSGSAAGVYTFDGRQLRRVGGFTYGGDSAQQYGFTCRRGKNAAIVQHQFLLESGGEDGRWQETDTTFTWFGAKLRRTSQHTRYRKGSPPSSLTRIGC
jgi:hypothetical protein